MARLTIDGQPEYTAAIKKPEMHGVGTQASGSQSGETSAKPASDPFLSTAATVAPDQLQAQSQSLTTALPGGTNANAMLPKAEPAPPFAAQVQPPVQPQPVVAFRADKAARDMGLEIARRVGAGGEELVIRLDPAELGRINIRMAVNEHGQLRAIVAADAPAVLDALRSDISELNRALEQAGIRTDSQSFRFDRGAGDSGSQWQQRYQQRANNRGDGSPSATGSEDEPAYRPMATNGRINMMA
jgi:flagellar hook-length control protein FliK